MNKLILTQEQKQALNAGFEKTFGGQPARYFSAPAERSLAATTPTTSTDGYWQAR